jgi:hypothetical protein
VAAGPRFLHLQPGLLHVGGGEQVTVQGASARQLAQPFTDLIIDHLVQLRSGLGQAAAADHLQQHPAVKGGQTILRPLTGPMTGTLN